MKTTKELINEAIVKLGFNLDSYNHDYCNVIQSCGMSNNIPTLHKDKDGSINLYGNVNITIMKVAHLDITYSVSISVNTKKKYNRRWFHSHKTIIPNKKLDMTNLETVKSEIWEAVRNYRTKIENS